MVRDNAALNEKIKALPNDDNCTKAQLKSQLRDIKSLGFCTPVGPSKEVKSIVPPSAAEQTRILEHFGVACHEEEDKVPPSMPLRRASTAPTLPLHWWNLPTHWWNFLLL